MRRRPIQWTVLATVLTTLFVSDAHADKRRDSDLARDQEMSRRIDVLLNERLQAEGIEPAPPAEDAEFMRRAYLDMTGVIPSVSEARTFLADSGRSKRARLIDELLASPRHAVHLANTWRKMLLTGRVDPRQAAGVAGFESWLRRQFAENLRYDNLVAELLVATGQADETSPAIFYTSLETEPKTLASATARAFLGLRIECAECHDHPFDAWSQRDFWGYAAFFAQVEQRPSSRANVLQVADRSFGEVMLPDSDDAVPPKYLGGSQAEERGGTRRVQLGIWMASRDNPFLARATVNRVWSLVFGRGLVEPVDDLGPRNPASHPELLDELSGYFVEIGFDMRRLWRTIANTAAYQRSGVAGNENQLRPELFAAMALKPLSAEQLYESLTRATRLAVPDSNLMGTDMLAPERLQFATQFETSAAGGAEYQAGIPQALAMMNGPMIAAATEPSQSGILVALEAPFFTDAERVDALFLATLSRFPSKSECDEFVGYVERGGAAGDRRQALGDVLWALVNSAEFTLNH